MRDQKSKYFFESYTKAMLRYDTKEHEIMDEGLCKNTCSGKRIRNKDDNSASV